MFKNLILFLLTKTLFLRLDGPLVFGGVSHVVQGGPLELLGVHQQGCNVGRWNDVCQQNNIKLID